MDAAQLARDRRPHGRDDTAYVCADGVVVPYKQEALKIRKREVESIGNPAREYTRIVPRNGIRLKHGEPIAVSISGTVLNRDMAEVFHGGPNKTYTFPSTVIAIR